MKTNVESKSSILFDALDSVFGKEINNFKLKLMSLFIIALNQFRTVSFDKLTIVFDHNVKKGLLLEKNLTLCYRV